MPRSLCLFLLLLPLLATLPSCSSTYYNTLEKFGVHKRDVMVDRVGEARDAQEQAKQQFQSAFEQFSSVVEVKGGDLEEQYDTLKMAYDKSEEKAKAVHERIASVESVAEALFDEWGKELDLYSSAALRRDSEQKLEQTRVQYNRLISAMKRAEDKIQPVLDVFYDQVLYLKHNLNARAISALQGELVSLEKDVARLVREMETSIREADQFISKLQNG